MPLARYTTAGALIKKVGVKQGLSDVADPFASADPDYVRLVSMLNEVGQDLAEAYEWRHLLVEATITGDGATTTYDLPADFQGMVEQSGWNRTTRLPTAGPLTVQRWQYRAAQSFFPLFAEFRQDTNQVRFVQPVPSSQVIKYEYRSRSWVRPAASGLGNGNTLGASGADEAAVTGDWVLYDPLLFRRHLELAWREANGFDTVAAQAAAQRSLDRAQDRTAGAPALSLSQRRRGYAPPDGRLPDGNW